MARPEGWRILSDVSGHGAVVIEIPSEIRDEMIAHAVAGLPNEACGLLAGSDGRAERFYPLRNADDSPVTYRLDPKDQLKVFDEIEEKGWNLVGIFHSHTRSEAFPSETDRRQAFYPEAHYVLVSLADREHPVVRGFTIRDEAVEEPEVRIA
jgi:[CysO sulfur-carrier protein]-S-L-cysteine hydrolase